MLVINDLIWSATLAAFEVAKSVTGMDENAARAVRAGIAAGAASTGAAAVGVAVGVSLATDAVNEGLEAAGVETEGALGDTLNLAGNLTSTVMTGGATAVTLASSVVQAASTATKAVMEETGADGGEIVGLVGNLAGSLVGSSGGGGAGVGDAMAAAGEGASAAASGVASAAGQGVQAAAGAASQGIQAAAGAASQGVSALANGAGQVAAGVSTSGASAATGALSTLEGAWSTVSDGIAAQTEKGLAAFAADLDVAGSVSKGLGYGIGAGAGIAVRMADDPSSTQAELVSAAQTGANVGSSAGSVGGSAYKAASAPAAPNAGAATSERGAESRMSDGSQSVNAEQAVASKAPTPESSPAAPTGGEVLRDGLFEAAKWGAAAAIYARAEANGDGNLERSIQLGQGLDLGAATETDGKQMASRLTRSASKTAQAVHYTEEEASTAAWERRGVTLIGRKEKAESFQDFGQNLDRAVSALETSAASERANAPNPVAEIDATMATFWEEMGIR